MLSFPLSLGKQQKQQQRRKHVPKAPSIQFRLPQDSWTRAALLPVTAVKMDRTKPPYYIHVRTHAPTPPVIHAVSLSLFFEPPPPKIRRRVVAYESPG